jgi:hypothetical protein
MYMSVLQRVGTCLLKVNIDSKKTERPNDKSFCEWLHKCQCRPNIQVHVHVHGWMLKASAKRPISTVNLLANKTFLVAKYQSHECWQVYPVMRNALLASILVVKLTTRGESFCHRQTLSDPYRVPCGRIATHVAIIATDVTTSSALQEADRLCLCEEKLSPSFVSFGTKMYWHQEPAPSDHPMTDHRWKCRPKSGGVWKEWSTIIRIPFDFYQSVCVPRPLHMCTDKTVNFNSTV